MDNHEQVEYNYITSRLFQNPKLRENITKYLIETETQEYVVDNITPVVKSRKRCHEDTENVPPKSLFGSDKDVVTQAAQSGGENHYSVNTNNTINNFITLSDGRVVSNKYHRPMKNDHSTDAEFDKTKSKEKFWKGKLIDKSFMLYIFHLSHDTASQDLFLHFNNFHQVLKTKVSKNEIGRSYGIVSFSYDISQEKVFDIINAEHIIHGVHVGFSVHVNSDILIEKGSVIYM